MTNFIFVSLMLISLLSNICFGIPRKGVVARGTTFPPDFKVQTERQPGIDKIIKKITVNYFKSGRWENNLENVNVLYGRWLFRNPIIFAEKGYWPPDYPYTIDNFKYCCKFCNVTNDSNIHPRCDGDYYDYKTPKECCKDLQFVECQYEACYSNDDTGMFNLECEFIYCVFYVTFTIKCSILPGKMYVFCDFSLQCT